MSTDFYGVSGNKCNCCISPKTLTPLMKNEIDEFKNNNLIRAHKFDAGCDIKSAEDYVLKPWESKLFKTGLKVAIPNGYVGIIKSRSGLAVKHNIEVGAGVIDSTYSGECMIMLRSFSNEPFHIKFGYEIAQMLLIPISIDNWLEIHELPKFQDGRNEGGFGSTDKIS